MSTAMMQNIDKSMGEGPGGLDFVASKKRWE